MAMLNLADLVRTGTMSPGMAATLAAAAEERRSLLFVAIPRLAGKSTVMQAALQYAPDDCPFHVLSRAQGPGLGIPAQGDGGYLVVAEISPAGFADYLWGPDAQRVFAALPSGFSLATALHAPGVDEAFQVLTRYNGIPDALAGRIDLVVYIRTLGAWHRPSRRVVEGMYEIDGVAGGRPNARLLYRWEEGGDRFETVDEPRKVGTVAAGRDGYQAAFDQAASQP